MDPFTFLLSSFALGFLAGVVYICNAAHLSFWGILVQLVTGKEIRSKPTELFFFPDPGMPCNSYYLGKRCFKLQRGERCDFLHAGANNSSLMKVMDTMKHASQIDLCMYRFTLEKVADLFERLHRQGKRIRIITDNSPDENNQIPRLKQIGIEVRERPVDLNSGNDRWRPLMHNKFVIVDRECCMLGSFNWTLQAVTRNSETIIKSHESSVVAPLVNKFEEMWRELGQY